MRWIPQHRFSQCRFTRDCSTLLLVLLFAQHLATSFCVAASAPSTHAAAYATTESRSLNLSQISPPSLGQPPSPPAWRVAIDDTSSGQSSRRLRRLPHAADSLTTNTGHRQTVVPVNPQHARSSFSSRSWDSGQRGPTLLSKCSSGSTPRSSSRHGRRIRSHRCSAAQLNFRPRLSSRLWSTCLH